MLRSYRAPKCSMLRSYRAPKCSMLRSYRAPKCSILTRDWINYSKLNLQSLAKEEYVAQHRNNVHRSDFAAFQDYLVSF